MSYQDSRIYVNTPCKFDPPTFDDILRITNALKVTLRRPEDRECLDDILAMSKRLNTSGIKEVIQYNNQFLIYFLKVLRRNCASQPLDIYEQWYGKEGLPSPGTKLKKVSRWLEDDKKYFFMEKTSDGGIVFYTAITNDPCAGWERGGLAKL